MIRARRPRGEQGSYTFAVVFWALMTMLLAGLVVDGGLSITERQRAGDVAEQAAREGANDLDRDHLRVGTYQLAGDACTQAARVVTASGLAAGAITGCDTAATLTLPTGVVVPEVTVQIHIHYSPILLGMFVQTQFDAYASATAHPQPGN